MGNIIDYVKAKEIQFEKEQFNEIDELILARLSYFPLNGIIKENEQITIEESYHRFRLYGETKNVLQKEDLELFAVLANSQRYANLKISKFVHYIDIKIEKQFSAITIFLPNDTIYVSYRGTDDTIVGWKESFNMSFSTLVPSQIDAKEYLENIASLYNSKIIVGGHSKGGNLAIYASAFCSQEIQQRIIAVYNNDGPGFHESLLDGYGYKRIIDRIHTYRPQTSVIGRLLNNQGKSTIVKSTQIGILQHDLYSWQVADDKFIREELTNSSDFIDETIKNWLKEVNPKQRQIFINTLFDVISSTGTKKLNEFGEKRLTKAFTILKNYQEVDEESKKVIMMTLKSLAKMTVTTNINIEKKIKNKISLK